MVRARELDRREELWQNWGGREDWAGPGTGRRHGVFDGLDFCGKFLEFAIGRGIFGPCQLGRSVDGGTRPGPGGIVGAKSAPEAEYTTTRRHSNTEATRWKRETNLLRDVRL